MVLSSFLILFAQSPIDQTISYSSVAETASTLVQKLAKQTKMKLKVSEAVGEEVLVLSVAGVKLKDLMDRIAEACNAGWAVAGDQYLLRRTDQHDKEMAQLEVETKLKDLKPYLAEWEEGLDKPLDAQTADSLARKLAALKSAGQSDMNMSPGPFAETPTVRAVRRLMLKIPIERFALLQQGERFVYSNQPTAMQRKLEGWDEVLEQLKAEQAVWSEAVAKVDISGMKSDMASNPFQQVEPLNPRATRVVLSHFRGNATGYGMVRMQVVSPEGTVYAFGDISLRTPRQEKMFEDLFGKDKGADEEVPLSAESKSLLAFFYSEYGNKKGAPMPAAHRALFANPAKRDPLSYAASDTLLAYAKKQGTNLVAVLPDSLLAVGMGKETLTLGFAMNQVRSLSTMDIQERDGWTVMKTKLPIECAWERLNRPRLNDYFQSIVQNKRITFDDRATFMAFGRKSPSPGSEIVFELMLDSANRMAEDFGNPRMVRVYGVLSPEQRKTLAKNGRIPFVALAADQLEAVSDAAYGDNLLSYKTRGSGSGLDYGPFFDTLQGDPTERLPQGLPMTGYIVGAFSESSALMYDSDISGGGGRRSPATPEVAGTNIVLQERYGNSRPAKFRVCQQRSLDMQVWFTDSLFRNELMRDVVYDPTSRTYLVAELPEPIRKLVQRGIDAQRRAQSQQEGSTPKVPPPLVN